MATKHVRKADMPAERAGLERNGWTRQAAQYNPEHEWCEVWTTQDAEGPAQLLLVQVPDDRKTCVGCLDRAQCEKDIEMYEGYPVNVYDGSCEPTDATDSAQGIIGTSGGIDCGDVPVTVLLAQEVHRHSCEAFGGMVLFRLDWQSKGTEYVVAWRRAAINGETVCTTSGHYYKDETAAMDDYQEQCKRDRYSHGQGNTPEFPGEAKA